MRASTGHSFDDGGADQVFGVLFPCLFVSLSFANTVTHTHAHIILLYLLCPYMLGWICCKLRPNRESVGGNYLDQYVQACIKLRTDEAKGELRSYVHLYK